jgi:hypothetical protein
MEAVMSARQIVSIAAVLGFGLVKMDASLLAASTDVRCRTVTGNLVEKFDPATNGTTGTLKNAAWLDGTVEAVFNSDAFPTPDPNKVTFSSTMTIVTPRGELRGVGRTYLFDFVTGRGTDVTDIDPDASTGVFAGTTGVLYTNLLKSVSVATGPYYSVVVGRICFPRHGGHDR